MGTTKDTNNHTKGWTVRNTTPSPIPIHPEPFGFVYFVLQFLFAANEPVARTRPLCG